MMETSVTARYIHTAFSPPPLATTSSRLSCTDQDRTAITSQISPDSGNGEDLEESDVVKNPQTSPMSMHQESRPQGLAVSCDNGCDIIARIAMKADVNDDNVEPTLSIKKNDGDDGPLPTAGSGTPASDRLRQGRVVCDVVKPGTLVGKSGSKISPVSDLQHKLFVSDIPKTKDLIAALSQSHSGKQTVFHHTQEITSSSPNTSVLAYCGSLNCGPFSSCTKSEETQKTQGMNSLPNKPNVQTVGDATSFPSTSYQMICDNKPITASSITSVAPDPLPGLRHPCPTPRAPPPSSNTSRYSNSVHTPLMRRYTNPDVVMTQPTSGGLMTTSCDLMTSPPGQCACVNPGTSHACAVRSYRATMGVLNPAFVDNRKNTQVAYSSLPSSPRKLSLDLNQLSRDIQFSELLQSQHQQECSRRLSLNLPDHIYKSSQPHKSKTLSHTPLYTSQPTAANAMDGPTSMYAVSSVSNTQPNESTKPVAYKDLGHDLPSLNSMAKMLGTVKGKISPPKLTSPDWFSLLTPSQESCTQTLFTPADLQDELLCPAPYGMTSEVYQNFNATEANFVLHKPTRQPRSEPLPSPSQPDASTEDNQQRPVNDTKTTVQDNESKQPRATSDSTTSKGRKLILSNEVVFSNERPKTPDSPLGIIEPLATEDEEALKEGAKESRRSSLSERRKTNLDKIYIPKSIESSNPPPDVEVEIFDRDEYVTYKRTLSEIDPVDPESTQTTDTRTDFYNRKNSKEHSRADKIEHESDTKFPHIINNLLEIDLETLSKVAKEKSSSKRKVTPRKQILPKNLSPTDCCESYGADTDNQILLCNEKVQNVKEKQNNNNYICNTVVANQKSPISPLTMSTAEDPFFLEDYGLVRRSTAPRKQSLPTEDLFGARKTQAMRRSSLNPQSDSRSLGRVSCGRSIAPVRELEEPHSLFDEDAPRRRIYHRRLVLNARHGNEAFVPPSEKEQITDRKAVSRPKSGQRKRDRPPNNRMPEWKIHCENSITVRTSASGSNTRGDPGVPKKSPQRKHATKALSSPLHHDSSSNSDSPTHRTKHTRHHKTKEGKTSHRKGNKSHSRTSRRPQAHTNPMAQLSPLECPDAQDLFADKGTDKSQDLLKAAPLVPYEPLVEARTPVSPDAPTEVPLAHTGATRKHQGRPRTKKHRRLREGRTTRNETLSSSSSSSSSCSSDSSSSSTSSSRSSSSRGSSTGRSKSSSSESSESDSSSSSSSSSSGTSSSSDSSDIEDLLL